MGAFNKYILKKQVSNSTKLLFGALALIAKINIKRRGKYGGGFR